MKKQSPHNYRRQTIHSYFLILFGVILFMAFGCGTQKTGCESLYRNKKKFTAWIKRTDSDKVYVLDASGAIICTYRQSK